MVVFSPGGFEELFPRYGSDQSNTPGDGFVADAERHFATKFEVHAPWASRASAAMAEHEVPDKASRTSSARADSCEMGETLLLNF